MGDASSDARRIGLLSRSDNEVQGIEIDPNSQRASAVVCTDESGGLIGSSCVPVFSATSRQAYQHALGHGRNKPLSLCCRLRGRIQLADAGQIPAPSINY